MSGRARAWLLFLLLVPLALACGRRGPPVAPERRLPAAVQDLSAAVRGEGVRLQWTLPRIRVDRSPLREVRRAEIHRRLEGREEVGAPRPAILTFGGLFGGPRGVAGFERVADIMLAEPAAAEVMGDRVTYTDSEGLDVGRRYTYVVVTVDKQGRASPPSNRVAVAVSAPPRPPTGVQAQAGDEEVRLVWDAPAMLEDGSPVTGPLLYNVFRTTSPEAPAEEPVNPEPIGARSYVDLAVSNDTTYYYAVRALSGPSGPASRASELTAATPEDRTPPAQPRGLVAVVAGRTVRLAWDPVGDPDLAGYHVYRSTRPGRGYERLTTTPQEAATYTDTEAPPGQSYYYVVTAVDRARRANESIPSPEATATVP